MANNDNEGCGAIIGLVILGGLIALVVNFWEIILTWVATIAAVWFLVWLGIKLYRNHKEEVEAREQAAAMERARIEEEKERQEQDRLRLIKEEEDRRQRQLEYQSELAHICDQSLNLFEGVSEQLVAVDSVLDQAEADFSETAFDPFWDSIEDATKGLGKTHSMLNELQELGSKYQQYAASCQLEFPSFPINEDSVESLEALTAVDNRMRELIRNAQRDFQFTMIFRQRKRDELLVAGFTHFAEAINGVGKSIVGSIESLSQQIDSMGNLIDNRLQQVGALIFESSQAIYREIQTGNMQREQAISELQSNLNQISQQSRSDISKRELQHTKTIEVLEDIRHRRKPFTLLPKLGYTKYKTDA